MAPVSIDRTRYPAFGGRKVPHECSICGHFRRCVTIDSPQDGQGSSDEWVCGPCIPVAIDAALEGGRAGQPVGSSRPDPENRTFVYDDEQCDQRGTGLNHIKGADGLCRQCGRMTYRA